MTAYAYPDPAIAADIRIVSILDYGAVGDGVADCSTAFDNAIAYLATIKGGVIWVPAGLYGLTRTLNINADGLWIAGEGMGPDPWRGRRGTILFAKSTFPATDPIVKFKKAVTPASRLVRCGLFNLTVTGDARAANTSAGETKRAGSGVVIDYAVETKLVNVQIDHTGGVGLQLTNESGVIIEAPDQTYIDHLVSISNFSHGVSVTVGHSFHWNKGFTGFNGGNGIYQANVNTVNLSNIDVEDNALQGFKAMQGRDINLFECNFEGNCTAVAETDEKASVWVGASSASQVSLTNCYFIANAIRHLVRIDTGHLFTRNCTIANLSASDAWSGDSASRVIFTQTSNVRVDTDSWGQTSWPYIKPSNSASVALISVNVRARTTLGQQSLAWSNGSPVEGLWKPGDYVFNSSMTPGGTSGWSCTAAGGANAGAWATGTAYVRETWIKAANGYVYRCAVAGPSVSTIQPTNTTAEGLSGTLADGYSWQAKSATIATFAPAGT